MIPLPSGPLPVDGGDVYRLALSPDNRYIVWCGSVPIAGHRREQNDTQVWSIPERRQIARLPIADDVGALAISPNGQVLAISPIRGAIQLWDTKTWKQQESLGVVGQEGDTAWGMTFRCDGERLAVGNYDDTVGIWNLATRQVTVLGKLPYTPKHLSFSSDGRFLAAADFSSNIKVWDIKAGVEYWSFRAHVHPITERVGVQGAAFRPDGTSLVTAGTDGMVRVWDVPSKTEIRHFDGSVGEVNAMALSANGNLVAVAGGSVWRPDKPGGVRIWDVNKGEQVAECGPLDHGVSCIAFSTDSNGLAAGTYGPKGQIFLWNVTELVKKAAGQRKP